MSAFTHIFKNILTWYSYLYFSSSEANSALDAIEKQLFVLSSLDWDSQTLKDIINLQLGDSINRDYALCFAVRSHLSPSHTVLCKMALATAVYTAVALWRWDPDPESKITVDSTLQLTPVEHAWIYVGCNLLLVGLATGSWIQYTKAGRLGSFLCSYCFPTVQNIEYRLVWNQKTAVKGSTIARDVSASASSEDTSDVRTLLASAHSFDGINAVRPPAPPSVRRVTRQGGLK